MIPKQFGGPYNDAKKKINDAQKKMKEYLGGGRCGPLYWGRVCNCNGYEVYCNTDNGWCGTSNAHKNAQPCKLYDCPSRGQKATLNPTNQPTPNPTPSPTFRKKVSTEYNHLIYSNARYHMGKYTLLLI